jgi:mRNA interferase YafQ
MPKVEISPAFKRSYKRFAGKHPDLIQSMTEVLRQLEIDPRVPWLETHKLRGGWKGYLACSAGYDLRIVFEFVKIDQKDAILLIDIGTHDEVY